MQGQTSHPKNLKQSMPERGWRKGNPYYSEKCKVVTAEWRTDGGSAETNMDQQSYRMSAVPLWRALCGGEPQGSFLLGFT